MNENKNNLPYRFREEAFRRHEASIEKIVKAFPTAVVFYPSNVETFSCRLRDAMKSLLDNNWTTTIPTDFAKIYKFIRVGIRGTSVVAGSKESMQNTEAGQQVEDLGSKSLSGVVINNPDSKALESLFHLHHERLLTTPTRLHFDGQSNFDLEINKWQDLYDIAIEKVGENDFNVL